MAEVTFEELGERQMAVAKMVLEYADIEPDETNVRRYMARGILSFTEDARGHYCWYMDDDGNEICFKVETMEEIDTSDLD